MRAVKSILIFMMMGAIVGAVVASFVVPPMLGWYNAPGAIKPGGPVESICNLPEVIRYTSNRLLLGQLIGALIGAVAFLFPGMAWARRGSAGGEVVATS
jgi:hypothetical protein